MIRLFKRLVVFRKLALQKCSVYQKKEPACLKNVVNCRACYLLVNAIDYIVYQRLALIFNLTEHAFSFSIYKFKLQQMYHENKRNKYKMHQDVFENIWRHLNLYENFYVPSNKEMAKFRKVCRLNNWSVEFLWSNITGSPLRPLPNPVSISFDDYVSTTRNQFTTQFSKLYGTCNQTLILVLEFLKFDYQNHLISHNFIKYCLHALDGNNNWPIDNNFLTCFQGPLQTVFQTALLTRQSHVSTCVEKKSCLRSVYCVDTFVPCYNFCQIQQYENAKRVKKGSMCAESKTSCKISNECQGNSTQQ